MWWFNQQKLSLFVNICFISQDGDFEPVDNCLSSVLGGSYDLSDSFKKHYALWLEQEVFNVSIEWEKLLSN